MPISNAVRRAAGGGARGLALSVLVALGAGPAAGQPPSRAVETVPGMPQRIPLALLRGQVRAILPHPELEEATMDFALTEQQELIRKEVAALSRNFSLDYWLEKDRKHEYPDEFVKAFAEGGWLGLMIPEAYGGAGLGVTEAALMTAPAANARCIKPNCKNSGITSDRG